MPYSNMDECLNALALQKVLGVGRRRGGEAENPGLEAEYRTDGTEQLRQPTLSSET